MYLYCFHMGGGGGGGDHVNGIGFLGEGGGGGREMLNE